MDFLKKTKSIFAAFLIIVMMLAILIPFAGLNVFAETANIDVVLVIDDTGSMEDTDPEFLAGLAVRKFADAISSESEVVNVRFGIATYSDAIMKSANLGQTADDIKAFSKNNITQSGAHTDASVGVKWAVDQLSEGSADTKAVILIGDGENDLVGSSRTDAKSAEDLNIALDDAKNKDIKIYTLAINPQSDEFKDYFADIAKTTGGKAYLPKTAADIDTFMKEIADAIKTPGGVWHTQIPIDEDVPVTEQFYVPDGAFEMNAQFEHDKPIDIYFTAPDGNKYSQEIGNISFYQENLYSNIKIQEPMEGNWSVTVSSDHAQMVELNIVMHTELTVFLRNDQSEITQKVESKYIATVSSKGKEITDDAGLGGLEANLVVTSVASGKGKTEKMQIENGKFVLNYAIDGHGEYEVYAELVGKSGTIKSNVMTINVEKSNALPLWLIILIIFVVLILIAGVILLIISMRNKEGSDYVRGNVSMKLIGRSMNEDMAIFENNKFNCETVFEKKNTLSDLIAAYVKWYKAINTSELAEISLSQYFNSGLSEVTDKITICGNKKKQIIIRIPSGYEIQVDGMEVLKPKKIVFGVPEKAIDLKFKNQGCTYTINLVFTKNAY